MKKTINVKVSSSSKCFGNQDIARTTQKSMSTKSILSFMCESNILV